MPHNQNLYYIIFQKLFTLIQNYQLHKCSLKTENYYHIKASQLICIVNRLAGFFMVQVVTEGYFSGNIDY